MPKKLFLKIQIFFQYQDLKYALYIASIDFIIARGGFNTITECLILKPALLMYENNNKEIYIIFLNLKKIFVILFINLILKKL